MEYKYITENNLENKPNYMYSEYRGEEFLRSYFEQRRKSCINSNKAIEVELVKSFLKRMKLSGETQKRLKDITELLLNEQYPQEEFEVFLKAFEVRKRLHENYFVGTIKPADDNKYFNYNNYLLLACCCIFFYQHSFCLKYLNTLLKVNDTLLSLYNSLSEEQMIFLNSIIITEVLLIEELLKDKNVCVN